MRLRIRVGVTLYVERTPLPPNSDEPNLNHDTQLDAYVENTGGQPGVIGFTGATGRQPAREEA